MGRKVPNSDPHLPPDHGQMKSHEITKMVILYFFMFDYCIYSQVLLLDYIPWKISLKNALNTLAKIFCLLKCLANSHTRNVLIVVPKTSYPLPNCTKKSNSMMEMTQVLQGGKPQLSLRTWTKIESLRGPVQPYPKWSKVFYVLKDRT